MCTSTPLSIIWIPHLFCGLVTADIIRVGGGPALLKRRAKLQGMFEALVAWKETNTLGGCQMIILHSA